MKRLQNSKRKPGYDSKEIDALIERYVAQSNVISEAGRQALAEALATCVVRERALSQREAAGDLAPEIARTLSGLASNIMRLAEALGVSVQSGETDEPLI